MASNGGSGVKKVSRPPLKGWTHFKRADKRAYCVHFDSNTQNACTKAKQHLEKCDEYKSLFPPKTPLSMLMIVPKPNSSSNISYVYINAYILIYSTHIYSAIYPLELIVDDSSNDVTDETKMKLLSYAQHKDFVSDMKQLVTILQPTADCIYRVEGNSDSIADMIEQIMMMSHVHNASLQNISVHGEEVKTFVEKYISNSKIPSALLANMLHPLYLGSKLSSNDKSEANSFLVVFIGQLDIIDSKKDILKSYQEFYTKEGYFNEDFIGSLDLTNALSWWKMIRYQSDHKQLADIAIRLLHVQLTNTAVGRSFSSQNFIHRKERNRLSAQHLHELLSVYCNINTFDNDTTSQPDDIVLESDDEDKGKQDVLHIIPLILRIN